MMSGDGSEVYTLPSRHGGGNGGNNEVVEVVVVQQVKEARVVLLYPMLTENNYSAWATEDENLHACTRLVGSCGGKASDG
jgi:hypothetical protein